MALEVNGTKEEWGKQVYGFTEGKEIEFKGYTHLWILWLISFIKLWGIVGFGVKLSQYLSHISLLIFVLFILHVFLLLIWNPIEWVLLLLIKNNLVDTIIILLNLLSFFFPPFFFDLFTMCVFDSLWWRILTECMITRYLYMHN